MKGSVWKRLNWIIFLAQMILVTIGMIANDFIYIIPIIILLILWIKLFHIAWKGDVDILC